MQRMTIASEEARRAIAHSVMMAPIGSRGEHWTSNQDARSGGTVPRACLTTSQNRPAI